MVRTVTHTLGLYDSPEPNVADYAHPSPATPGNLLADLGPVSGTVILDRDWSPYVQASFVIGIPKPSVLDQLEPRVVTRRLFLTSTTRIDGVATVRTFDLMLRSRVVDWVAGTVELTATSDEARLVDLLGVSTSTYSDMAVSQYLSFVFDVYLNWGGRYGPPPFKGLVQGAGAEGNTGTAASGQGLQETPGQSLWDSLSPVLQANGLRVWCDNARQWHLDKADAVRTEEVDLDYRTNLIGTTDTIDRNSDAWGDQVVITYSWIDAAGNPHTAYDVAGYYGVPRPTKGVALQLNTPKPAGGPATRYRQRLLARGRQLQLTAVADWTARPDMVFTALVSPLLPVQRGYLTRVELDLGTDRMILTTRDVVGGATKAWVVQQPGTSWASIPAGVAWSTYDAGDDRWNTQPAGRAWSSVLAGTSWAAYETN